MPLKLNGKTGGPVPLKMQDLTDGAGVRRGGARGGRPPTEIKPGWRLFAARDAVPKISRAGNKTTAFVLSVTGRERSEWDDVLLFEQGWAVREDGELTRTGEMLQEIAGCEVPDSDLPDVEFVEGKMVAVKVERPETVKGQKFFRYSQVVHRTAEQLESDGLKEADLKVERYQRPDRWQTWADEAVAALESESGGGAADVAEPADEEEDDGPGAARPVVGEPTHAPGAADPGMEDDSDIPF